jgi:integrase/recombinase XerD
MALPQNEIPANAETMLKNMAKALGLEIEIKGTQEPQEQEPVKKRKGRKLPKVLSRAEIARIFKAINVKNPTGLRNYVAYLLMYRCGLRVSEVVNLSVKDVNFETAQIYVQQSKNNKDRYIPMDAETIAWCKRWLEIRPASADRFLSTLKGTELSPRYFNQSLERLSQKTGIYIQDGHELKPMHCHVFRHCFATELIEEGYSIIEVQRLLGHSSIQTTQCYAHCRDMELGKKISQRKSIIPQ